MILHWLYFEHIFWKWVTINAISRLYRKYLSYIVVVHTYFGLKYTIRWPLSKRLWSQELLSKNFLKLFTKYIMYVYIGFEFCQIIIQKEIYNSLNLPATFIVIIATMFITDKHVSTSWRI